MADYAVQLAEALGPDPDAPIRRYPAELASEIALRSSTW